MAQQWHVFADAYNWVNTSFDGMLDGVIGGLTAWAVPALRACAIAYIAGIAIAWALAPGRLALNNLVPNLLRIAVVMFLVSSVGSYHQWAADLLLHLPEELTNAIAGTSSSSTADQFDRLWNDSWVGGQRVFAAAPSGFAGMAKAVVIGLAIIIFLIVAIIAIGFSFLVSLIALVTLKFCVAFGPLFIACFAFPVTKRIGDNWLGVCASAILTIAAVAVLMGMLTAIQQQTVAGIATPPAGQEDNVITMLQSLFACGVVFFIAAVLVKEIPSIAGRIASGIATRIEPYQQAAGSAASATVSGGKVAASATSAGVRAVASRISPAGRSRSVS